MDATTLVTFMFKTPPHVRSVELFGSWDNFARGYRMQHDIKRGRGTWTGCFPFDNIVFDGDRLDWSRPRSGGLKQGGTYWFYYRLDDQFEAYDDGRPCTTNCPLLPGQAMNVLDVPVEVLPPPSRCRSASGGAPGLLVLSGSMSRLDPEARYSGLEPPPFSKVHERCRSDADLGGRLENRPSSRASLTTRSSSSRSNKHSLVQTVDSPISKRARVKESSDFQANSSERGRRLRLRQNYRYSPPSNEPSTAAEGKEERPSTRRSDLQGFDSRICQTQQPSRHSSIPRSQDSGTSPSPNQQIHTSRPSYPHSHSHFHQTSNPTEPPRYGSAPRSETPDFSSPSPSPSPDPYPSDPNENLWSPTFSAATMSSTSEDLVTPFRLSGIDQNYHDAYDENTEGSAMHQITSRLRGLAREREPQNEEDEHDTAPSRPPPPQAGGSYYSLPSPSFPSHNPTTFNTSTLSNPPGRVPPPPPPPQPTNLSPTQVSPHADHPRKPLPPEPSRETRKSSLGSLRLGREAELTLPTFLRVGEEDEEEEVAAGSLTEAIFGELGFLRGD
ncbi:hypothetical protein MBLNU230_g8281t1 [Neophaeotheca triangularis]